MPQDLKIELSEQVIGLALGKEDPFRFIPEKPVLKGEYEWEKNFVDDPSTRYRNGKFFVFYGGGTNTQYVGVVVSDDGLNWEKLYEEPFIKLDRIVRIDNLEGIRKILHNHSSFLMEIKTIFSSTAIMLIPEIGPGLPLLLGLK
ncbi:hypothetical protein H5T89_10820 [bacterium]|nr:hypothetical protein [bacterium]